MFTSPRSRPALCLPRPVRFPDVQKYLLSYSLWPVAILGATALSEDEQCMIDEIIDPWARRERGQAVRLRGRLETIWATKESNEETLLLQRLHMLMEMG